jgi:Asp-tRNA(Asn)/Glu-tRNA(Gln) amidotransferase C subunit
MSKVTLTPEEVSVLARAAGLPVREDDLAEVTTRVNTFMDGLAALDGLDLASVQPMPVVPHPVRLP